MVRFTMHGEGSRTAPARNMHTSQVTPPPTRFTLLWGQEGPTPISLPPGLSGALLAAAGIPGVWPALSWGP